MTKLEAITIIKGYKIYALGNSNHNEAFNIAIKSIEKQIAKKPVIIDNWKLCPSCYEKYGFSYDILVGMTGEKTNECHCLNCGQKINLGD